MLFLLCCGGQEEAGLQALHDNDMRVVVAGLVAFDFCFDAFVCKQVNVQMHHACLFHDG